MCNLGSGVIFFFQILI